jgi:prefoldin subunit 5
MAESSRSLANIGNQLKTLLAELERLLRELDRLQKALNKKNAGRSPGKQRSKRRSPF